MPRLRVSATELENRKIIAGIKYGCEMSGINPMDLAVVAHIDRSTLYRRLKDPTQFRLCELRAISQRLHIPMQKLILEKEESA
ncbi:MAG: hypothetical protein LKJ50_03190 [Clostridiales bacterium]|jgi:hypothetical protein|nr:hypothetical protein [Clostridiales bacterium]MCI1960947.1 hypothetical protein [Clostridiales bacterium]MCI2021388.1 hypothetical protein [Clostridiales bacterium]MCI2025771.1 hypothetical protein [Clostridiales bacterium]